MAIAPLSSPLANTLGNPTSTATGKAAAGSASIGKELLAALAQAQTASGVSADSLWQDQVSLGSAGQSASTPLTYDAKGLLQQLQNNMRNNPLWQTDSSDSTQSLFAAPSTAATGTSTTQAQALAAIGNGNNTNWAQMLKQNPALAGVMVDSQTAQSMISMLA